MTGEAPTPEPVVVEERSDVGLWGSDFEIVEPDPTVALPPSLVEAVRDYRAAGMLTGFAPDSDEQLARRLDATWEWRMGRRLPHDGPELDLRLLELDEAAVLTVQLDCETDPHNRVYLTILRELELRAGAAFELSQLAEEWWDHRVVVRFAWRPRGADPDAAERQVRVELRNLGIYVDLAIVEAVNGLLADGGPRFWFADNGAARMLVAFLSAEQRDRLERSRPLRLAPSIPQSWHDFIDEYLRRAT